MARCCRESKKLIKLHKFYFSLGILACFEKEKVFSLIEFSIKKARCYPNAMELLRLSMAVPLFDLSGAKPCQRTGDRVAVHEVVQ